jgi:hypothetical protein
MAFSRVPPSLLGTATVAQTILFHVALVLFAVAATAGAWALRDPLPVRIRSLRVILGAAAGSL